MLLLATPMLFAERAVWNAERTLWANGCWPTRVVCKADGEEYVCTADLEDGRHALLRCRGDRRDACTGRVYGKKR
jgi:hypothetical protein